MKRIIMDGKYWDVDEFRNIYYLVGDAPVIEEKVEEKPKKELKKKKKVGE